ncbi:MAG: Glycosyltransferase [Anaerolineae bacterium]|nr:MAG: Glycosyltransferase [Anaerolineae bacterium]
MVTILVDATDITQLSGSRTAVYELYKAVIPLKQDWRFIIFVSALEREFLQYQNVKQVCIPSHNRLLQRMFLQLHILKFELLSTADIVHFARSVGGYVFRAKSIVSVFDISSIILPNYYPFSTYVYWKKVAPWLLSSSTKIIAISHTVKNDLVNSYGFPDDKIEVVYCAPKTDLVKSYIDTHQLDIEKLKIKYSLPNKYLLYLGILAKKKNLPTLIKSLVLLKKRSIQFPPLVISGDVYRKSDDFESIKSTIQSHKLQQDVMIIGPVRDDELAALYSGAEIFVYPSLHEGFGIPCIEAMVCGVPVITTASGAIPEIVADAAYLIENPLDPELYANAIALLINNPEFRQKLIDKGKKRSQDFEWTKSAKKLIEIFESII